MSARAAVARTGPFDKLDLQSAQLQLGLVEGGIQGSRGSVTTATRPDGMAMTLEHDLAGDRVAQVTDWCSREADLRPLHPAKEAAEPADLAPGNLSQGIVDLEMPRCDDDIQLHFPHAASLRRSRWVRTADLVFGPTLAC